MEDKELALDLYNQGVISRQKLAEEFGIDWEEEKKRIKEEIQLFPNPHFNNQRAEFDRKQIRIEQARRNVEALGKLWHISENNQAADKVTASILENIDIMNEVKELN
ncbi:MAG: hypothetical protein WC119_01430 [Synergistaceae bacterium]